MSDAIPSQHSHDIVKQLRVAMAFGLVHTQENSSPQQEPSGRESKPNNQMWFKAYHWCTIHCGIFHSGNHRDQIARQPIEGMVFRALGLGDCRFLLVVIHVSNSLVLYLGNGQGSGGRHRQNVALHPGVTLGVVSGRKIVGSFVSNWAGSGAVQRAVNERGKRFEGKEWEVMRLDVLNGA
jgi:hypothetical protein